MTRMGAKVMTHDELCELCARMDTKLDSVVSDLPKMKEDIQGLRESRSWLLGASAAIGILFNLITGWFTGGRNG
jgi:hypothetical protein